jgi:hypothetical protein
MINKLLNLTILLALVSCSNQNNDGNDSTNESDTIKDLKSISTKWTDSLQKQDLTLEEPPINLDSYDNIELILENEGPQEETD